MIQKWPVYWKCLASRMYCPAYLFWLYKGNKCNNEMSCICEMYIRSASVSVAHCYHYVSPHRNETVCVHMHLVVCVQPFWSSVYVKLWLTPSRCSCWRSSPAAILDTHTFSLRLGSVIHRAGRANMLNCWPPFILGLSHKRFFSMQRQSACVRGKEMWVGGGGRIPQWQWV